jgi:biopolymer transport protein ExbD
VDTKLVVKLKNFEYAPADLQPGAPIPALFKVLFQERKRLPEPNTDSNLLVLADEETPYSTIRPILASAAAAGFVDLQLVVVQKD